MSKHFPTFAKWFDVAAKSRLFGRRFRKFFKGLFYLLIVITLLLYWSDRGTEVYEDLGLAEDYGDEASWCEKEDNVQGIFLSGSLLTYIPQPYYDDSTLADDNLTASEDVVYYIQQADKDEQIKAILLEIDCFGGSGTAAREIVKALEQADKPTVALIREYGASACYWAALGADMIFADVTSNVGSIGVTMSYLDYSKQNEEEGLTYQQITSAKFKDAGSPDKELTAEEKVLLQRDVDILHDIFVQDVAAYRHLDIAKVKALADGFSLLGQAALDNGLIDKLGDRYDVDDYLREKLGEEVSVCW